MINGPISANGDHHSGQKNTQARFRSSTAGPSAAGSSGVGGLHGKRKADTAAETGILGRSRLLSSSAPADDTNPQHRAGAISQLPPLLLNLHKTVTAGESTMTQMLHHDGLKQPCKPSSDSTSGPSMSCAAGTQTAVRPPSQTMPPPHVPASAPVPGAAPLPSRVAGTDPGSLTGSQGQAPPAGLQQHSSQAAVATQPAAATRGERQHVQTQTSQTWQPQVRACAGPLLKDFCGLRSLNSRSACFCTGRRISACICAANAGPADHRAGRTLQA